MNQAHVDKIVNAVLYEGYVLYPYRPSVKNRQRWTFGGIYPRSFTEAQATGDASAMQTECLLRGIDSDTLQVKVRFLHLLNRFIKQLDAPLGEAHDWSEAPGRIMESLQIDGKRYQSWQEAVEREIAPSAWDFASLSRDGRRVEFQFPASRRRETIRDSHEQVVAFMDREQHPVVGSIAVSAQRLASDLFKIRVRIENRSTLAADRLTNRDEALLHAMVSTHTILESRGGEFISSIDPPADCREFAAGCQNIGAWPVLVGASGERDAMLSSPIILYDYPEIAPESPGDLFDGAEIDEILSLRILTMTDDEKQSAAAVDERVRALLHRTESLDDEQIRGLHGMMRTPRTVPSGGTP